MSSVATQRRLLTQNPTNLFVEAVRGTYYNPNTDKRQFGLVVSSTMGCHSQRAISSHAFQNMSGKAHDFNRGMEVNSRFFDTNVDSMANFAYNKISGEGCRQPPR
jgi:hypothetical protein